MNAEPDDPLADSRIRGLLEGLYQRYHYDFRRYAMSSLRRRLESALTRFQCRTLDELSTRALGDPGVFQQLLDYLTVQVSDMFRDPPFFLALREHVLPVLATYPSIKVWVAGCSTGEEAWSLAILLHEEGLLERSHIYATDINPRALRAAADGVYDLSRVSGFTRNHQASGAKVSLSEYYTAAYGSARFDARLKRHMVFSDHSLATDSVFSEVQLVTCRNVLIYFDRELQDRALSLFREALCAKGFLGIGSRESMRFSAHGASFVDVCRDERIYQKRGA